MLPLWCGVSACCRLVLVPIQTRQIICLPKKHKHRRFLKSFCWESQLCQSHRPCKQQLLWRNSQWSWLSFQAWNSSIEFNSFLGNIQSNLSRCSNLINLFFHVSKLVGEIPLFIGYLLKLEYWTIMTVWLPDNSHLSLEIFQLCSNFRLEGTDWAVKFLKVLVKWEA